MVGNDIVDLGFFDLPASQHVRYLDRVCTPEETEVVRDSTEPCTCLAAIWASKEAAYKLVSNQLGRCGFVPRRFVTDFKRRFSINAGAQLLVSYGGTQAMVEIVRTDQWVHAVATFPNVKTARWEVREIEKCVPLGCQARTESNAVRSLANTLLSNCGCADIVLNFSARIPTLIRKNGNAVEMGISLSHHGAFVSAAIAWPITNMTYRQDYYPLAEGLSLEKMCSTSTA